MFNGNNKKKNIVFQSNMYSFVSTLGKIGREGRDRVSSINRDVEFSTVCRFKDTVAALGRTHDIQFNKVKKDAEISFFSS